MRFWNLALLGAALLLPSSCSREKRDLERAREVNTIASYSDFLRSHPQAESRDAVRGKIRQLEQEGDFQDFLAAVKHFLNGDAANNGIQELNAMSFAPRDQKAGSGMTIFGASSLRVSSKMTSQKTGKAIKLVYEPTSNRLIKNIETLDLDEGMGVTFSNGNRYLYQDKAWVRQTP